MQKPNVTTIFNSYDSQCLALRKASTEWIVCGVKKIKLRGARWPNGKAVHIQRSGFDSHRAPNKNNIIHFLHVIKNINEVSLIWNYKGQEQ